MSIDTITTVQGNTYEVYFRENEYERIVMVTDRDGVQHIERYPKSFSYSELLQMILEDIES